MGAALDLHENLIAGKGVWNKDKIYVYINWPDRPCTTR